MPKIQIYFFRVFFRVDSSSFLRGMALKLEDSNVSLMIFGDDRSVLEGDTASKANWYDCGGVHVGPELLGRVVDGLGEAIDGKGAMCPS